MRRNSFSSPGLQGGGADRLGVHVGLVGANQGEGDGLDGGRLALVVGEEDLDGDAGQGLVAGVADMAVEEGGGSSGDAGDSLMASWEKTRWVV